MGKELTGLVESSNDEEDVFSDPRDGQPLSNSGKVALDDVPRMVFVIRISVILTMSNQ